MNGLLLKIANMVTFNLQNKKELGLVNGKMGTALFYYELSRYTGIKTYSSMADILLDEIVNNLGNVKTKSLERGLAGIGWGVNYLIRNSFVNADDDILEDLELYLFSKKHDYVDFDISFSTLSPALYLLSKPGERWMLDKHDDWVSALLDTCDKYLLDICDKKEESLNLINSMLYFLIELKKQNIHILESSRLIERILKYFLNYGDMANNKCGDFIIFLSLLEQIESSISLKKEVLIHLNKKRNRSGWDLEAYKKMLWQQFLFSCHIKEGLVMADIDELRSSAANEGLDTTEILVPLGLCLMNIDKNDE